MQVSWSGDGFEAAPRVEKKVLAPIAARGCSSLEKNNGAIS
jgi:hypothetical protein